MLVFSAPFSVTRMLEIIFLLKSFMSWTITSSPLFAAKLSPSYGGDPPEKKIKMDDTFRPSISSCTPYLVCGNWIWWGFQWWRDVISICGWTYKSFWEGYHVSRKIIVPSYWRHAVNSESGILIAIGLLASYGFSCISDQKCWHWFGLIRVCCISLMYNASLNTKM